MDEILSLWLYLMTNKTFQLAIVDKRYDSNTTYRKRPYECKRNRFFRMASSSSFNIIVIVVFFVFHLVIAYVWSTAFVALQNDASSDRNVVAQYWADSDSNAAATTSTTTTDTASTAIDG